MITIISGGQTGADQAGWRAAKAAGLPTGGWMPGRFMTEEGPRPEFAELYGAKECVGGHLPMASQYAMRTRNNVRDADITFWFNAVPRACRATAFGDMSPGFKCTLAAARGHGKRMHVIQRGSSDDGPEITADVLRSYGHDKIQSINIAGNRESKARGIGQWVEGFLAEMFGILGEGVRPAVMELFRGRQKRNEPGLRFLADHGD